MRTRIGSILLTGGAAVLAIGLSVTSSFATTSKTWTVKPGGAITATSGNATLTDTTTGTVLTCKSSRLSGAIKSGSGLSGAGIGSFTSGTGMHCTVPLGLTLTLTPRDLPWQLNFTSYDASTHVIHGTFSHVQFLLSGTDCTAVVDGTSGTASDGVIPFAYTTGTGKLKLLSAGENLHFYDVSGCLGLVDNGDSATYSGTYTITPKQTITSP